jgi:hypothetical protein
MSDDDPLSMLDEKPKMNKMKVLGLGAALATTVAVGIGVVSSYSKANKAEETIQQGTQDISQKANEVSTWKDNAENSAKHAEKSANSADVSAKNAKFSEENAKSYAGQAEGHKNEAYKAAAEKPVAETYRMPLSYESPLIGQMLPGLVKAAYARALQSNQQKDWAVYEIAARFFVDQNIDTISHDGYISKEEYRKFVDANPDLEILVTPEKIAEEFQVEMPSESYRAKWREVRAKINRIADIEQKNRWSDVEFVRYALMPGMEKTPDKKSYFTTKEYSEHFEGRVNNALTELEGKK